jgi:hypothetical protein
LSGDVVTTQLNYHTLPKGTVLVLTSSKGRFVVRLAGPVFEGHSRPVAILEAPIEEGPRAYMCVVPHAVKRMAQAYEAALATVSPGNVVYLYDLDKVYYESMPCFEITEVRVR